MKETEQNIFTKIMNVIENNTDMPKLEKDIEDWKKEDKENITIYEIYKLASEARELQERR